LFRSHATIQKMVRFRIVLQPISSALEHGCLPGFDAPAITGQSAVNSRNGCVLSKMQLVKVLRPDSQAFFQTQPEQPSGRDANLPIGPFSGARKMAN
jgi:hypothetical protein